MDEGVAGTGGDRDGEMEDGWKGREVVVVGGSGGGVCACVWCEWGSSMFFTPSPLRHTPIPLNTPFYIMS